MLKKRRKATIYYIAAVFWLILGLIVFLGSFLNPFALFFGAANALACFVLGRMIRLEVDGKLWARRAYRILDSLYIALWMVFLVLEVCIISGDGFTYEEPCDYLIVLGAKVDGRTPSWTLQYRLDSAIEYLNEHPQTVAVMCGGQGANEVAPEAEIMKEYAVSKGIAAERILEERASRNTMQNLLFAKEILDARGGDYTVCAVTNGFHAFRTHLLLGKAGLTQNVLAAGEPPMLALSITNRIREAFSLVAAWIRY